MVAINDAILVLTSAVSPPPQSPADFALADNGDGKVYIIKWNKQRLGSEPSAADLAAVTAKQVDAYYKGLAIQGGAALIQEVSALTTAVKLGDIYIAQELNALIAWINNTLLPVLNAPVQPFTIPDDISALDPGPLTVQDGKAQAMNVILKQPGWLTT